MSEKNYFSDLFINNVWPYFMGNAKFVPHAKENILSTVNKLSAFTHKDPLSVTQENAWDFIISLEKNAKGDGLKGKYSKTYVKTMYRQLRAFYHFLYDERIYLNNVYHTTIDSNPFAEVYCEFQDKEELTIDDIPSYEDIDRLLSQSSSNITLCLAIKLSLKLGLTISEELKLKKTDFIEQNGEWYLQLVNISKSHKKTIRTLHITKDLSKAIDAVVQKLPADETHVIVNISPRDDSVFPYTIRTLQRHLNNCCLDADIRPITFSDLRNFFILHAKMSGVSNEDIADFTKQEGRWISRFDVIDVSTIKRSSDYINFILK